MILKDSNFSSTIYSFSNCAWNITTVEINSGIHLLKSEIRQVPLFTSGGLKEFGLVYISHYQQHSKYKVTYQNFTTSFCIDC